MVVLLLQLRPGPSGRTHGDQAADLEQLQFEHQQRLTGRNGECPLSTPPLRGSPDAIPENTRGFP
ncbi:hypothetical protein ACVWY2_007986 [Bradyrhizobium sp. JR6.1]